MNTITVIRPGMPDRNGLPGFRPYVYRGTGTDTLTPHLDEPENRALMPCGTEAAVLTSGLSPDCGSGCHAPLCSGRNCTCECHR